MDAHDDAVLARSPLAIVHELMQTITSELDLSATLDRIVDAAVTGLGFAVCVINVVDDSGGLVVAAVGGREDARQALLGTRGSRNDWDELMALGERAGRVCFVPHGVTSFSGRVPTWVPPIDAPEDAARWHPMDALFAVLSSRTGELLGALSVDMPESGRQPSREQLELLDMFAAQASIAVENARLHTAALEHARDTIEVLNRLTALLAAAPIAILQLDLEGNVQSWNAAATRTFGWSASDVLGRRPPFIPPSGAPEFESLLSRLREGQDISGLELRRLRRDGSEIVVELSAAPVMDADGAPIAVISVLIDVTERARREGELAKAAFKDPLTDLANRALFDNRLELALARVARRHTPMAVLILDLDGFKKVNDTYGHGVGDEVLVEVAQRLIRMTRPTDTVARLGGDEFALVIEDQADPAGIALGSRILKALADPARLSAGSLVVSASVGVAATGPVSLTGAELVRRADMAMYAAKRAGGNDLRVFGPELGLA
ncbi:MAG: diguanylate cyclase [Mycobacteriales bacterium]